MRVTDEGLVYIHIEEFWGEDSSLGYCMQGSVLLVAHDYLLGSIEIFYQRDYPVLLLGSCSPSEQAEKLLAIDLVVGLSEVNKEQILS